MNVFESKKKRDREAKFSRIGVRTTSADMELNARLRLEIKFYSSKLFHSQTLGVVISCDDLVLYIGDNSRMYSRGFAGSAINPTYRHLSALDF